jgi:hypothetical protein
LSVGGSKWTLVEFCYQGDESELFCDDIIPRKAFGHWNSPFHNGLDGLDDLVEMKLFGIDNTSGLMQI